MKRKTTGTRKKPTSQKRKLLKNGSLPEKYIQQDILGWLKTTGYIYWRQNSGVIMHGHRRIFLGDAGLPDILVIVPPNGLVLGLEVKSATGALRAAQKAFRDRLNASGGIYKVVRSVKDAMNALAEALGKGLNVV